MMKTIFSSLILWFASVVFAQTYEEVIKEQDAAVNIPTFSTANAIKVPRFKPVEYRSYPKAQLLVVDKIEVSNQSLVLETKQMILHKKLSITVESCFNSPKHVQSDVALVQIKQGKQIVFHGWMFANSPSLNPMEHPFYDIILTACYE